MATLTTEPVLSLSTVIIRQKVRIDGKLYDLRNPDELPWLGYRDKANEFARVGALLQVRRRTKAQQKELDRRLPALIEALLLAPKPVLDKLTTEQRFAIVTVFSQLLLASVKTKAAGATAGAGTRGRQASSTRTGAR